LPNDEIMAQTEKHCRKTTGFMPREDWRAEVERRLHAFREHREEEPQ
jgi:hypothetical protein